MVSSIGSGLSSQYFMPSRLGAAQSTTNTSASSAKTSGFRAFTSKNYFVDQRQNMSWTAEQFFSETSRNLTTLKQALSSYSSSSTDQIGTYSFSIHADGSIDGLNPNDKATSVTSGSDIVRLFKAADADQDGLISSSEINYQLQAYKNNGSPKDAENFEKLRLMFDVVSSDQFLQINSNPDGSAEFKVYSTKPLPEGTDTSAIASGDKPITVESSAKPISTSILSSILPSTSKNDMQKILQLLSNADKDKDGSVTRSELKDYKSTLEKDGNNDDAIQLIDKLLKTKDGDNIFQSLKQNFGNGLSINLSLLKNGIDSLDQD